MAKCSGCSMRLQVGSPICPRCGRLNRGQGLKYMMAGLVLVQAVVIACYMHFKAPGMPRVALSTVIPALVLDAAKPVAGWLYFDTRDELVNDTTKHARVISVTDQTTGSPRNHTTTGVLELRASHTYGNSVVITLKRGAVDMVSDQIELRAQFDAGEVQVYRASGSLDANNATLIISDTGGFTGRLAASHTLSIDAQLTEKTKRVANFEVGGLIWN